MKNVRHSVAKSPALPLVWFLGIVLGGGALPRAARALDSCYASAITGGGYESTCSDARLESTAGGSFPSFADSFHLNPAAIPVIPTPVGVEVIGSVGVASGLEGGHVSYAFIKGFQRFGSALSFDSDNTFFGNNVSVAPHADTYVRGSAVPAFRVGTSIGLTSGQDDVVLPTLGVSLHYNKLKGSYGGSLGFGLNSKWLSLGVAYTEEPGDARWPVERKGTLSAGLALGFLQADAAYLYSDAGAYWYATTMVSLGLKVWRAHGTVAVKAARNSLGVISGDTLYSLQCLVHPRVQLGYLYNYLPGAHSLGLQVMLL